MRSVVKDTTINASLSSKSPITKDYEWSESNNVVSNTTWNWMKTESRLQRGRKAYGRRTAESKSNSKFKKTSDSNTNSSNDQPGDDENGDSYINNNHRDETKSSKKKLILTRNKCRCIESDIIDHHQTIHPLINSSSLHTTSGEVGGNRESNITEVDSHSLGESSHSILSYSSEEMPMILRSSRTGNTTESGTNTITDNPIPIHHSRHSSRTKNAKHPGDAENIHPNVPRDKVDDNSSLIPEFLTLKNEMRPTSTENNSKEKNPQNQKQRQHLQLQQRRRQNHRRSSTLPASCTNFNNIKRGGVVTRSRSVVVSSTTSTNDTPRLVHRRDGSCGSCHEIGNGRGGAGGGGVSPTVSAQSGSSFSSLSRVGDSTASGWMKKTLQDGTMLRLRKRVQHHQQQVEGIENKPVSKNSRQRHFQQIQQEQLFSPCNTAMSLDLSDLGCTENVSSMLNTTIFSGIPISPGATTSSRKRGVCDSPVFLSDERGYGNIGGKIVCGIGERGSVAPLLNDVESSAGALSITRHSTSSIDGLSDRRSRSRIFSPDSTRRIIESCTATTFGSLPSSLGRYRSCTAVDKDDRCGSDSGSSTDSNTISSGNNVECVEDGGLRGGGLGLQLPLPLPRTRRVSSLDRGTFENMVFSPVDNGGGEDEQGYDQNSRVLDYQTASTKIFERISSYDDLKFMIKELRKWKQEKNFASFGMAKTCTIVLPNSWSPSRRSFFISWVKKELGFCHRSGGGAVNYLQATTVRGTEILRQLESSLLEHKLKEKRNNIATTAVSPLPDGNRESNGDISLSRGSAQLVDNNHNKDEGMKVPMTSIKLIPCAVTPFNHMSGSVFRSGAKQYTPMSEISHLMPNDLEVDNDLMGQISSLNIKSSGKESKGGHFTSGLKSPNEFHQNECLDGCTPLIRIFTLENRADKTIVEKVKESSCQSRLSFGTSGSVMDTREMVSHIHGFSPKDNNVLPPCRTALSLQKRLNRGSVFSPHSEQEMGFCNGSRLTSLSASLSFEGVETPMPKQIDKNWGSRPVKGRDWGQSVQCGAKTMTFLFEIFEESRSSALQYCDGVFTMQSSPYSCNNVGTMQPSPYSLSRLVHPGLSSTVSNSKALGIEFEADGWCQDTRIDTDKENAVCSTVTLGLTSKSIKICALQGPEHAEKISGVDFNVSTKSPEQLHKRRQSSIAKMHRMSICSSALDCDRFRLSYNLVKRNLVKLRESPIFSQEQDNFLALDNNQPCVPATSPSELMTKMSFVEDAPPCGRHQAMSDSSVLSQMFLFLCEEELLCSASVVCSQWFDEATNAHASLMLISVGCNTDVINRPSTELVEEDNISIDNEAIVDSNEALGNSIAKSMERSWDYLMKSFPWASFLSEGAFKRVYKVWNTTMKSEEAISVMNIDRIDNKDVVGAELAVSVMLSSLVRRNICPNFVIIRGVFTSTYEPPESNWGCSTKKNPKGYKYNQVSQVKKPREPSVDQKGLYQYIRMELCEYGDVEEFIKKQPMCTISPEEARNFLFQMAFALHTAGDRFNLKHYDVKLLNFFLRSASSIDVSEENHPFTVMRYGVGSHVFDLRMPTSRGLIVKLADYGTANMHPESNGQPVLISNYTTIENTPPEFMILGDAAKQGYGHDCFGLGLCMLHLFTGHAPYEEILEDVRCPFNLKKRLKFFWESTSSKGYEVIRSVILNDVFEDENGNQEGEPDETLYHTLYRFLVLFGLPKNMAKTKENENIMRAITSCLDSGEENNNNNTRSLRRNRAPSHQVGLDFLQYKADCRFFSFQHGENDQISQARESLQKIGGGMDLLFSLVQFDPEKRASALDVINSEFMSHLRKCKISCNKRDLVYSYMAYSTK